MVKRIDKEQIGSLIPDGAVLGINGFSGGFGFPEELAKQIELCFQEKGHPRDLTLLFGSGCGDSGKSHFGLEHFAHEEMTKRVVCGHVGLAKTLSNLIHANQIEGYNFPQGVVTRLFQEIAGQKLGVITHVGLETFADPRQDGGKMNEAAKDDLVELIHISGKEQLLYKSMPVQVALIRGTTADEDGNITMEKEAILLETLQIAQAAKNSGGIVIAQVERMTQKGMLRPMDVQIPGILVDYLVVADKENHKMNSILEYRPEYSGETRLVEEEAAAMPLTIRKIIARRCSMELKADQIINLGIGMPDGISSVTLEEGIHKNIHMTIESGIIGGIPAAGICLGASANAQAMITQSNIFDYYDGGGLNIAFLGMAQADRMGNINVSKFNGRMMGCGGFVNITQNARKVVFCGTFTAGCSTIQIKDGALIIPNTVCRAKFLSEVEQITFSGKYAHKQKQEVLYVTERAVFALTEAGLVLTEIAPGVDLEQDILGQMEFKPIISESLSLMDSRIFREERMGIAG